MVDEPTPFPDKAINESEDSTPPIPEDLKPRLLVVGVGGAGCNAIDNMIRSNLAGVDFIACNTDAQALSETLAENRIQLGPNVTQGLGAGSQVHIGKAAAEESIEKIRESMRGHNMIFVTAGMGGGTGTGASPVIAEIARDLGILTVGVVTKPFNFEGPRRTRQATSGIEELENHVDTMIVIPNQNLFLVADNSTTFLEAFNMADDVLYTAIRGVTDLIVLPGLVNLDFADIKIIMRETGKAMMGTGEVSGEERAIRAAEAAISNPLLENSSIRGAKGLLINITGGSDLMLHEVDEVANRIRNEVPADCFTIFGSALDENLNGKIRVYVVATGMKLEEAEDTPHQEPASDYKLDEAVPEMTPLAEQDEHIIAPVETPEPTEPAVDDFSEEAKMVDAVVAEANATEAVESTGQDKSPDERPPSLFDRIAEVEKVEQEERQDPEITQQAGSTADTPLILDKVVPESSPPEDSTPLSATSPALDQATSEPDWNKLIPVVPASPTANSPDSATPDAQDPLKDPIPEQSDAQINPFLVSARNSLEQENNFGPNDQKDQGMFKKISKFFSSDK